MLSKEENELLTRVGPGTPSGEMLRRYWWPVGFTEHVKEKGRPVRTRLLGEDLVLFRDGNGRLGLLGLHCSHRGTSCARCGASTDTSLLPREREFADGQQR